MSECNLKADYGFATRAVHVGNEVDKDSGAIKRPITMANSYALPYDPTDMNWSSAGGNLYTRNGFFRFSVGIEDVEDIIGDLRQALEKAGLEVTA